MNLSGSSHINLFDDTITMVEKEIGSEILPYCFESMSISIFSDWESNIIKSKIDSGGQASFIEQLSTIWCKCMKCASMW